MIVCVTLECYKGNKSKKVKEKKNMIRDMLLPLNGIVCQFVKLKI